VKRTLGYSIATASLAGLLTGGVMKLGPDALAEHPIGPQIRISGENNRTVAANDWSGRTNFASYNGEIPEYVIGTDWIRPIDYAFAGDIYGYDQVYFDPPPAPEPQPRVEETDIVAPVKVSTPPPVPKPASYPSVEGDILADVDEDEPDAPTTVVEAQTEPDALPS
jgi:hypothetical protein